MQPEENYNDNEPQITPEQFLADQKRTIRRRSWWAIGIGSAVVLLHLVGFAALMSMQDEFIGEFGEPLRWRLLFRSIFFILGLLAVIGGCWGLYYAKNLKLKDLIPTEEAILYLQEAGAVRPVYTYVLVACIVAVTLAQFCAGLEESVDIAGFVKPDFINRQEYWRLLTGAALHGGFLHIYFNGQALFGFGSLIEHLSNRAHLPIVFLLAVISGGLLSLVFMPEGRSVGASGGIMGLIGYMAIFGYKRKRQLPPDFLRSMLVNIAFIAAFGLIAYQFIDNFAHLGGLIAGTLYGLIQIPSDPHANPRRSNFAVEIVGAICLAVFIGTSIFSILRLTNS